MEAFTQQLAENEFAAKSLPREDTREDTRDNVSQSSNVYV